MESGRKAIHQKVGADNFFSPAVSHIGECVLPACFVYTLKCSSLVLVLVYMRTVPLDSLSLCYVQQSGADISSSFPHHLVCLLPVCPCLHFVSDVYPMPHVDKQYNRVIQSSCCLALVVPITKSLCYPAN